MKKIILIIMSVFCINLYAEAPIWKISKDNNHIYLGGSMHLLSKDDYPLKKEFKFAFDNSNNVVLETDLSKLQESSFQKLIQEKSVYSNGKKIKDFLSKKTYTDLKIYFKSKNLPSELLNMKPGFILSTVGMVLYSEAGLNIAGVDAYIEHQAKKKKKKIYFLETPEEQIELISNMGIGNEENFIKYTLADIDKSSEQILILLKAWKNGDTELLDKEIMSKFKKKYLKTYNSIIVKRNNNWLPQIEKMFKTKEIEFVLVGFAHLSGEDSVLTKLKKLGYKIEKVKL